MMHITLILSVSQFCSLDVNQMGADILLLNTSYDTEKKKELEEKKTFVIVQLKYSIYIPTPLIICTATSS